MYNRMNSLVTYRVLRVTIDYNRDIVVNKGDLIKETIHSKPCCLCC